jgi:RHS repeat-associated protein
MVNDGTNTLTYDNNGNLTAVGADTYTWDRANRLLSHGGINYAYDGAGNRIEQDNGTDVTQYLLDVQPSLVKVLAQTVVGSGNTERFVHGIRGIHAVDDGTDWSFYAQDGLGSVRGLVDDAAVVQSSMSYDPYGVPDTSINGFAYTGEMRDSNGLQYHRARYYDPALGIWTTEDFLETPNRYGYVSGNPINRVDPSGNCPENPAPWDFLGRRCKGLARGLSEHYNIPLERLMARSYFELEGITALGTFTEAGIAARQAVHDAAIIPNLAKQDFSTLLAAFNLYIVESARCGDYGAALLGLTGYTIVAINNWTKFFGVSLPDNTVLFNTAVLVGGATRAPSAEDGVLGGIFLGYGIAEYGPDILSFVDTLTGVRTRTEENEVIYQFSNRDGSFKNGPSETDHDGISVAVASLCGNQPAICLLTMFGREANLTDKYRESTNETLTSARFIVTPNGGQDNGLGGVYPLPHASVTHPDQTYRENGSPRWSNGIKKAFGESFGSPKSVLQ